MQVVAKLDVELPLFKRLCLSKNGDMMRETNAKEGGKRKFCCGERHQFFLGINFGSRNCQIFPLSYFGSWNCQIRVKCTPLLIERPHIAEIPGREST